MKGFTLIETIIYIALFSILMGGAAVTAWSLFESNNRSHTVAVVQEEGGYLLGKIQWALYGAKAVTNPQPGLPGSVLTVVSWNTALPNPLQICLVATGVTSDMYFATSTHQCVNGATDGVRLNNDDVSVYNLNFAHATSSGDGINPESIRVSFTVSGVTPNGMRIDRDFSGISYIRQ